MIHKAEESLAIQRPLSLTGEGQGEGAKNKNTYIRRARRLRINMTDSERKLWKLLRSEAFVHWKFRRQHPIGPYIADFVCVETMLIIEVDGGQHFESAKDDERTAWLNQHGWHVMRFWNNEILQNIEGVGHIVHQHLNLAPSPAAPAKKLWAATSPVRERL